MKTMKNIRRLVALGVIGTIGVAGCELAVDFDRTKIDSGTVDASMSETSTDAPVVTMDAEGDGTVTDAAMDTATDAVTDTAVVDSSDGATTADADDASDADGG